MPLKMMGGSEIQNRFMLMKFIFKLFSHGPAPWKNWILRDAVAFDTPSNGSSSYLWQIIDDELMTYRSVTYVNVLNGASTSFWFDDWFPKGPLFAIHSALFSHTIWPDVLVQEVSKAGFDLCLWDRLTSVVAGQLADLVSCLQGINLCDEADEWCLKLTSKVFITNAAYAALDNRPNSPDPNEH